MTREQLIGAAILLRGAELHDLDALLGDGCSHVGNQRSANRDPLAWTMRLVELGQLVHLGRCLPLLAYIANIAPEELQRDIEANSSRCRRARRVRHLACPAIADQGSQ